MFFQFKVNLEIFPIKVVRNAINSYLDKAYFLIDGDKNELMVNFMPKNKKESNLELEFKNQLINYSFYYNEFDKTKNLKETIVARTVLTNNPDYFEEVLFEDDL